MLKVLKSGFYTTIQDDGRFGQRRFGVPVSGAMDAYSSQFANAILGNSSSDAVLEITLTGPKLQFTQSTRIALSGADMCPKLNDELIKMNMALDIKPNDILSFGKLKSGCRTYLAVINGFKTDIILDSRSMFKGLTDKYRLSDGDEIPYSNNTVAFKSQFANVKYSYEHLESKDLGAYMGPEFHRLTSEQKIILLDGTFAVSKFNNRMAYQLEPKLKHNLNSIITSPVLPGTVQLTPSGQLIVLMRDCQTTGGYPRVLQLTENAINIISQKTTGSSIKIRLKEI